MSKLEELSCMLICRNGSGTTWLFADIIYVLEWDLFTTSNPCLLLAFICISTGGFQHLNNDSSPSLSRGIDEHRVLSIIIVEQLLLCAFALFIYAWPCIFYFVLRTTINLKNKSPQDLFGFYLLHFKLFDILSIQLLLK